jgi:hypothetical protein
LLVACAVGQLIWEFNSRLSPNRRINLFSLPDGLAICLRS